MRLLGIACAATLLLAGCGDSTEPINLLVGRWLGEIDGHQVDLQFTLETEDDITSIAADGTVVVNGISRTDADIGVIFNDPSVTILIDIDNLDLTYVGEFDGENTIVGVEGNSNLTRASS